MYAISTIRHGTSDIETRTVGVFETSKEAFEVFEKNLGDLAESNYYKIAVVEEIELGLYPQPKLVACFQWNEPGKKWQKCKKTPGVISKHLEQYIGFCSIG